MPEILSRALYFRRELLEEKTYQQMRQEFILFYQTEVKPRLPEYTKMRQTEGPLQIAFMSAISSFFLLFLLMFLNQNSPVWSFVSGNTNISRNPTVIDIILAIILAIDIVIFIGSTISLYIYSSKPSPHANKSGNTRYIQQDLEMDLKQDLMPKFVNIFLENGNWYKKSLYNYNNSALYSQRENVQTLSEAAEYIRLYNDEQNKQKEKEKFFRIKKLHDLKILNPFPRARYDDAIIGSFRDVPIRIYEIDTQIIKLDEVLVIILLCAIIGSFFWLLLIILLIPLLIYLLIMLLVFSFKIAQYSRFRGLVVEFDMNKNFKGHTIFHENSNTAKKIPINKTQYQKVNLESVTFEEKYNVYSTDQIEARYLLTPSMMERIENLKFTFKAKYVRGSFKANKLTLAIHTGKDMLAMGSDYKDSDSNTFQELYDEMISILKIVDVLKLNEHIGL